MNEFNVTTAINELLNKINEGKEDILLHAALYFLGLGGELDQLYRCVYTSDVLVDEELVAKSWRDQADVVIAKMWIDPLNLKDTEIVIKTEWGTLMLEALADIVTREGL